MHFSDAGMSTDGSQSSVDHHLVKNNNANADGDGGGEDDDNNGIG